MPAEGAGRQGRASVGIDLGGSKIAVALATAEGRSLDYFGVRPTPKSGPEEVALAAEALVAEALEVARSGGVEVSGIGVAVPEVVGLDGSVLSNVVVPGLRSQDWVGRFGAVAPTVVESDVRAGALAEASHGAGRGAASFCYVTVGTGVSYCLVLGGIVHRGARGAAILLGNTVAAEWQSGDGREEWVLEEIASGPALLERSRRLGGSFPGAEAVVSAYGDDPVATRAVEETARALGVGLGLVVNLLDPERLVLGGGLGSAEGPFFDLAERSAREHIWCAPVRSLPIVRAELGPRSAAVGAAMVGMTAARSAEATGDSVAHGA